MRILISPHLHPHLLLLVFFITVILVGMKCYLIRVFMCTLRMAKDVEDLSACILTFSCIFFGEMSTQIFCPVLKLGCLSFYCWVVSVLDVFWIQVSYSIYMICKSFLPFCELSFYSFDGVLWSTKVINSDVVQLVNHLFLPLVHFFNI